MEKLIRIITNRWFIQSIGIICLALLIWFIGPLVAIAENYFLASEFARLLAIVIVVLCWAGITAWRFWRQKKKNQQLLDDLGSDQRDQAYLAESAREDEQAIIRERFDEALQILRNSKGGSGKAANLYELPWYIIIGPPGSGKTTALINSGLNFPLADRMGSEAIQGIGGTRHCDWWFTDEAVMIDTAGRFTTQDSHESVDRAAWQQFMDLLKKNRPQQPVNGVWVTMSIADLMQQSEDERALYAQTIRRRIEELNEHLGISAPVYFTFTKCDLISGFSEFFGHYDRDARAQVWGETFQLPESGRPQFNIDDYADKFDTLTLRLEQQLIERMYREQDPDKRTLIMGFPRQFSGLRDIVSIFLGDIFSTNRYSEGALLRGVYFTSGTQAGTPIDRLLGTLAQSFGFSNSTLVGASGRGKSFFLKNLLQRVVFVEAGIAGVDQQLIRRRRWMQRLVVSGALAVFLVGTGLLGWSFLNNEQKIQQLTQLNTRFSQQVVQVPMFEADFLAVLPELNTLRDATRLYDDTGVEHTFGLYQGHTLTEGARSAYLNLLQTALLPVLSARIEELIIASDPKQTSTLYELLKTYLMYGGIKPYDADLLTTWAVLDWQETYALDEQAVEDLSGHMQVLMENGFLPAALNEEIVSYARRILSTDPLEKQVYQAILRELSQEHKYDLALDQVFGPYAFDLFKSKQGDDLTTFVMPGVFTKQGFYTLFLPNSTTLSKEYIDNNWVMGDRYQSRHYMDSDTLQRKVLGLYYDDFIQHWDGMIDDMAMQRPANAEESIRQISVAAGLDSPLRHLVETLSEETTLTKPFSVEQGEGTDQLARTLSSVNSGVAVKQQKVSRLMRDAKKAGLLDNLGGDLGQQVERYYTPYYKLLEKRGSSSLLDRLSQDLAELSSYMDDAANSSFSSTGAIDAVQGRISRNKTDPLAKVNSYQADMPQMMQGWLGALGAQNWSVVLDNTKTELNQLWQSQVTYECKNFLEGRYPVKASASSEVTLEDFSRFFGPDGTLDSFVNTYLRDFIDTKGRVWVEREVDGQKIGLTKETLLQLQKANDIKETFFRNGELSVPFIMRPVRLDTQASKFYLSIGSQEVTYRHGPRRSSVVTWPSLDSDTVRLRFEGLNGEVKSSTEEGPWAWFRLLNKSHLNNTSNRAVYEVNFARDELSATFELRAKSVINPFAEDLLAGFRCQESL